MAAGKAAGSAMEGAGAAKDFYDHLKTTECLAQDVLASQARAPKGPDIITQGPKKSVPFKDYREDCRRHERNVGNSNGGCVIL